MTHPPRIVPAVGPIIDELLARLFPATCVGCGAMPTGLCDACRASLVPPPAVPPPVGIDWWTACWAYAGPVREVVARAKYRGARAALAALVPDLVAALGGIPVRPDVVTWAPASATRRSATGVDHARILARGAAFGLALPVRPLLRRSPGPPQTGGSVADRRIGPALRSCGRVSGATVLVVDDVATTGATLASAARALRAAGATRVVGATLTRTPVRTPMFRR